MTGKGVVCRASIEPGYALQMDGEKFGHLHCNRCGWVTPGKVVLSYSTQTDRHYLTWDDLMSAEANGWVVVGTSTRPNTAPVVVGPYDSQEEARKAQARLRSRWIREERRDHGDGVKIRTSVRALWKEDRS
jgi:hypothetical protein